MEVYEVQLAHHTCNVCLKPCHFSMTTLLDPRVTLAYLAYLGYPSPTTTALTVTKPRKAERKKKNKVNRTTYLIYVFGAVGSGKSAICRNLAGKRYIEESTHSGSLTVVNSVEYKGAEKYLVVQEFAAWESSQILRNSKKLGMADLLVFVYDSSDTNSFPISAISDNNSKLIMYLLSSWQARLIWILLNKDMKSSRMCIVAN